MVATRFVEVYLEGYHAFEDSEDVESRYILIDIRNAIRNAPLTLEEKLVLKRLYFDEPMPPQRDKQDKNGFTNGRPAGGSTQTSLADELNIGFRDISRIKQSAILKISEYLGDEYNV